MIDIGTSCLIPLVALRTVSRVINISTFDAPNAFSTGGVLPNFTGVSTDRNDRIALSSSDLYCSASAGNGLSGSTSSCFEYNASERENVLSNSRVPGCSPSYIAIFLNRPATMRRMLRISVGEISFAFISPAFFNALISTATKRSHIAPRPVSSERSAM